MLLVVVLLFLPIYLLFKAIMFVIMEFRFFGGALLEAIRASVTKTKYPRTFEFAARIYLSEMFNSIFEICKIPFVVWKDNEDTRSKSLKELLGEELELYKYNWGITIFIFLSLCFSFAITVTCLTGRFVDFNMSNKENTAINPLSYPPVEKKVTPNNSQENKTKFIQPNKPIQSPKTIDFDKELAIISKLDNEIQNSSMSYDEKQKRIKLLGEKFTLLLKNVDDCKNAKKIYSFAKDKLEPNYGINTTTRNALKQIEEKCLN